MRQTFYLFHLDSTEFTTNLLQTFSYQSLNPHMLLGWQFPSKQEMMILVSYLQSILLLFISSEQILPKCLLFLCGIILREIDPIPSSV